LLLSAVNCRMAKLVNLKVQDLRRELEERDLETIGNKAVLQDRLRQALKEEGVDPDAFIFETDSGKILGMLEEKFLILQENSRILKVEFDKKIDKIEENVMALKKRLEHLESEAANTNTEEVSSLAHQEKKRTVDEDYKGSVILPGQLNGLPTFDGKMPWEDYLSLFETAAVIYGWTPAVRAAMLSLSLRGDALTVLQTVPMADRQNIGELLSRLEMRFGHRHMEQLYRSQLKSRIQKSNESLQEFESDIARLVRNAYPSVDNDVYESLAVDKFLDGLREPETQQAIKLVRPQTLSEALTQALEFEAVRQSVRSHAQVRVVEAEDRSEEFLEEVVKRILEKLKVGRREVRCWGCGEKGHLRNKCQNKQAERKEQEN
jgi:hypothetical protein